MKQWNLFFQILKIIHAVLTFAELYCVTKDPNIWLAYNNKGLFFTLAACYLNLAVALLLLHVSSEISEIQAGEQLLFGPLCSYNGEKKKEIWQKYVLALKSAWMFVYTPLAKAKVSGAEIFTPVKVLCYIGTSRDDYPFDKR